LIFWNCRNHNYNRFLDSGLLQVPQNYSSRARNSGREVHKGGIAFLIPEAGSLLKKSLPRDGILNQEL